MTGPSTQISKYFHIQRSNQLGGIIGQLDKAAQLVSEHLVADFTALFHRRPSDDSMILVACNRRQHVEVTQLNLLNKDWSEVCNPECLSAMRIIDLNADESNVHDLSDAFATANAFRYRAIVPLGEDSDLSAMIAVYWLKRPCAISDETARCLKLLLELVASTMSVADRLHEVSDFSVRLARVMSIQESGNAESTFAQASAEITRIADSLGHNGGACFLIQEDESSRYTVSESVGEEDHGPGLMDLIAAASIRLNVVAKSAPISQEVQLVDISDCVTDDCEAAVAVDITPDDEHRCALAFWTHRPAGFTESDLELQTVLAKTARNVLTFAVTIERISKSKRTLEKSTTRMVDAEAMAALTDMTSGIAHDFNNVVGGIVGRVQLLKMTVDEGPMAVGLSQVESLAMEGAETLRRIQEFTRRTRNKKLSPIDLAEVLGTSLGDRSSTWRELAKTAGVDVVCTNRPEAAIVDGDADDLVSLIDKLIENAVEHSSHGATVEVALKQHRSRWLLTVADRGDGISEEIRKKVFYPFFTTKTSRGAGLGLAIAHGIAISHGAKIEIEDRAEGGTIFRVSLESSDGVCDESDITKGNRVSDRLRILVVDDDEQIRDILSDMLTIDGHSSTTCADGYQALEAIDAQPYDLVITDLGMPGMSGLDLAAVVHEKYPELPIAMITGWGTQIDEEDASLKGIKIVLPKPFHLKDVKSLVRELAGR